MSLTGSYMHYKHQGKRVPIRVGTPYTITIIRYHPSRLQNRTKWDGLPHKRPPPIYSVTGVSIPSIAGGDPGRTAFCSGLVPRPREELEVMLTESLIITGCGSSLAGLRGSATESARDDESDILLFIGSCSTRDSLTGGIVDEILPLVPKNSPSFFVRGWGGGD